MRLLNEFCTRHALPDPDPDEQGHYQLGLDQVEVSLFEDLGKLYLMAEIARLPDKIDDREQLIKKSCAYLLPFLYIDECVLNLYNNQSDEYLMLVSVMPDQDAMDAMEAFEARLSALVNRAEGLIAHLQESDRPRVDNRVAVFRP